MPVSGAHGSTEAVPPRLRGAPQKYKRIPAIDLINGALATDWKQFERVTMPASRPDSKANMKMADITSSFALNLWAYFQPVSGDSSTAVAGTPGADHAAGSPSTGNNSSSQSATRRSSERLSRSCKSRKAAHVPPVNGLDLLFGSSNGKRHLFDFEEEPTNHKLKRTIENCDAATDIYGINSQYSSTTLEDCERFSSYYATSVGSDFSSDVEDSKQLVSCETLREIAQSPTELLRHKCERFFSDHGLVVKVRRLPVEGSLRRVTVSGNGGDAKDMLCYPAYHFISRQRNHMFEQLMRGRTFLDTRYNSCNEMRNSKSPFSLIELHDGVMKQVESLRDDLCDPEFSGIYISVSSRAFESDSEFGRVRRSKTVAWALIELLTSNERCLRGLWVHPSVSAPATTALLLALIPYSIMTSFCHSPSTVDENYPIKTFCAWLNDFDIFPRQALILLTSFERFGLVKHHDVASDSQVFNSNGGARHSNAGTAGVGHKDTGLSHVDAGVTDEKCFCCAKADWEDHEHVIIGCTEQLMLNVLSKWVKQVPDQTHPELLDDLERIVLPESVSYNTVKAKEMPNVIRDAEFTGLSHIQIRNLLLHIYGSRWKTRLKLSAVKRINEEPLQTKVCKQECFSVLDEREERRKRRAQVLGQV